MGQSARSRLHGGMAAGDTLSTLRGPNIIRVLVLPLFLGAQLFIALLRHGAPVAKSLLAKGSLTLRRSDSGAPKGTKFFMAN